MEIQKQTDKKNKLYNKIMSRSYHKDHKMFIKLLFLCSLAHLALSQTNSTNNTLPIFLTGTQSNLPVTQQFQLQYNSQILILLNWVGQDHLHGFIRNQDTGRQTCNLGRSTRCTLTAGNYSIYFYKCWQLSIASWNVSVDYFVITCPAITNCIKCLSTTSCEVCKKDYGITSSFTCKQCPANCAYCPNGICIGCYQTFLLKNRVCQPCSMLVYQCQDCQNLFQCNTCLGQFVLNANFTCSCPQGLWEVTNICINMVGCTSALIQNGSKICKFCDIQKNFQLSKIDQNCTCKSGFDYSPSLMQCIQICGDGILFKAQCDDNNTENNDGCSQNCTFQDGFQCKNYLNQRTFCLYTRNIQLKLSHIWKNQMRNSADFLFNFQNLDEVSIKRIMASTFRPVITANITQIIKIKGFQIRKESNWNEVQLFLAVNIQYNETLEGSYLKLDFSFQDTEFLSQNQSLSFLCTGKNYPLIISLYYSEFSQMSTFTLVYAIVAYAIILFMVFFDKFIGVETLITIQLIYFSQLLVEDIENWPQAFIIFAPLKIVTGYNNFLSTNQNQANLLNDFFIKFRFLDFRQTFLVNNITNIIILLVMTLAYAIIFVIKDLKATEFQTDVVERKKQKTFSKFKKQMKYSRKAYQVFFNFCMIISLQLFASVFIQTISLNKCSFSSSLSKYDQMSHIFNKLLMIFGLVTVLVVSANNFLNILLNQYEISQDFFQYARHQKKYVKTFILYVYSTGLGIFCFSSQKITQDCPVSMLILVLAVVYLFYLLGYRPYKYTLFVHQFGIVLNQVALVITLLMINLVNLYPKIGQKKLDQTYILAYSYFICVFSTILIMIAMVRFYYQFREGALIKSRMQTQEQIRKQQQNNKQLQMKQKKMRQIIEDIQDKQVNNKKQNEKKMHNIFTKNNIYLYQNQLKESQQLDYLLFLQGKKHLTQFQRDKMYFRKYKQAPKDMRTRQKQPNQVQISNHYRIESNNKNQTYKQGKIRQDIKKRPSKSQRSQNYQAEKQIDQKQGTKNSSSKKNMKSLEDEKELRKVQQQLRISLAESKQRKKKNDKSFNEQKIQNSMSKGSITKQNSTNAEHEKDSKNRKNRKNRQDLKFGKRSRQQSIKN